MIERILSAVKLEQSDVDSIFAYGSRVYGTFGYTSDYDFFLISERCHSGTEVRNGDLNVHLYTPDHFQSLLDEHKVGALEAYFAPDEFRLLDKRKYKLDIDFGELRSSFSSKSSNSWVKCKKKLADGEYYIAKKSLWHSIRILMFGSQIAEYGAIRDFSCANFLYSEIVNNDENDWGYYKDTYQQFYNSTASQFKSLAPKASSNPKMK